MWRKYYCVIKERIWLMVKWKLRKAVKEDEHIIRELFIEMLQAIYMTENVNGYEEGYLDKFFNGGDDWICVAETDGKVVAYLSIEVYHGQEEYIYLDDLSVSEKYRGNGIGTELIKAAERFAREINIPVVFFHVEQSNILAFELYKRLGYSIMKEEGTRFGMIKKYF